MEKNSAGRILVGGLTTLFGGSAFAADVQRTADVQPAASAVAMSPSAIFGHAKASLLQLGGLLPTLGWTVLILVVGCLLAVVVARLLDVLLETIRLEKGAKRIKIPEILKRGGIGLPLSTLVTDIVFFLLIVVTFMTALEVCGLGPNRLTGQLLSYIPHVLAAVFVGIVGVLLATLLSGIITLVGGNARIVHAERLGQMTKYAIVIVAGIIALKELGLGVLVTERASDMVLAGVVFGLALAFGLGAKERAKSFLDDVLKK